MYYRVFVVAVAVWLFAGCQTHVSRFDQDQTADHACVGSATYRGRTDTYTTDSCAGLFGDTELTEAELTEEANYHELRIAAGNVVNLVRIHETVWRQQRADTASGHTLESALTAAVTAVSKRLADVWPDSPPLCWEVKILPNQTRLRRRFSQSARHCVPLELAVRHRGADDTLLGNLNFVSATVSTQLHETCHVMARLNRGKAQAGSLEQRNVEELACNILGTWLEHHLLGVLFREPISTRFDELDRSTPQLVSDSQDEYLRGYAIPPLARRLAFHRLCSDRFVSTSADIEKLLDLFKEAYAHTGTLQRFVEDQLANHSCTASSH